MTCGAAGRYTAWAKVDYVATYSGLIAKTPTIRQPDAGGCDRVAAVSLINANLAAVAHVELEAELARRAHAAAAANTPASEAAASEAAAACEAAATNPATTARYLPA